MTTQPSLTPAAFAAKWHGVTTTEKASAQEHFVDLCRMLGEPTPHEADPIGAQLAFEKRVGKAAGGDGVADVLKRSTGGRRGPPPAVRARAEGRGNVQGRSSTPSRRGGASYGRNVLNCFHQA